jgi:hypothetical protein
VDVEPTPAFPGKLGQVPVITMGGGSASADAGSRTISLDGAPLTLPAEIAAIFNQAFAEGGEDFKAGDLVGTLSFAAQAQ